MFLTGHSIPTYRRARRSWVFNFIKKCRKWTWLNENSPRCCMTILCFGRVCGWAICLVRRARPCVFDSDLYQFQHLRSQSTWMLCVCTRDTLDPIYEHSSTFIHVAKIPLERVFFLLLTIKPRQINHVIVHLSGPTAPPNSHTSWHMEGTDVFYTEILNRT